MATVNSKTNTNTKSTDKGKNGFAILASVYNSNSNTIINNYQAITFDAVPEIGIRRSADVTAYPVEDGAEVSDNVQKKNNTFTLSGIITETPIRLKKDLLYSAGVNGTRVSQAIEYLDKIFDARQPIILVTENKIYENVILKGISYDSTAEFSMRFDLEFEQVRFVRKAETNVIATKTQSTKNSGGSVKTAISKMPPKSNKVGETAAATNTPTNRGP